jgi:hypothetical protein
MSDKLDIKRDIQSIDSKVAESGRGWSALSMCIAQIVEIHWEEMRCTLEILHGNGSDTRALTGVELLMPSMGNRHFMGGIPEIGDQCVVGWFAHDTRAGTAGKTPAILAWWPSTPWIRHDWHMTQGFEPGENIMEDNKNRKIVQNFHQRVRHKMRHFSPGNIGASSSQGSDMVLDESVLLTNRRANEIIIRDQDQAIVMRSLQQFHAMSGARVYAGMVQRDAKTLPREMFSDGIKWDADIQIDPNGNPYNPFSGDDNFENPIEEGVLQPHPVFQRENIEGFGVDIEGDRVNYKGDFPLHLDPYVFLYNGGFIDEENQELNEESDTIYGGKSILRVGTNFGENAYSNGSAFTEYRIEMNHTTDGTLPVTEQTDGFDSDRVGNEVNETKNPPFIEWVLGTPVGNDAFSAKGKEEYGLPIVPYNSTLGVANLTTPYSDHAATLLRVTPVVPNVSDSFVSFTKGGKFRAKVSSPLPDSFETRVEGGAFLDVASDLLVQSENSTLSSTTKTNISSLGAVEITASGSVGGDDLDGDEPNVSVIIKGSKRISLQSDTAIAFKSPIVDFSQVGQIRLASTDQMELNTGAGLNQTANTIKQSSMGQYEQVCGGPADFNPLAGPARKVTVTEGPVSGGAGTPSDSYTNAFGGKSEVYIGPATNTKTVAVGTDTKTITSGSDQLVVGTTVQMTDPTGTKFLAPAGSVTSTAGTVIAMTANVVSLRGNTAVTISGTSITLGSPSASFGPIVCGSDIHPILGVPYASFCPPRGQNLAQTI